ncbi:Cthe_2314 family HEPN domain-containing protein [Peribacillus simplex]|uniref:Cthe_2314 family HEPN domain-containing protein n=1 Tax=Peribacillus simplex TaxID=1478 RepID=UPI00381B948F
MQQSEKEYLTSLIDKVNIIDKYNEGFYIMGKNSLDENMKTLVNFNDIDSWVDNLNYINVQVKNSAKTLFDILEKNKDIKHSFSGIENREAYYFTENIMFRVSILWDLLAQLTNTVFQLNENVDGIHHWAFFEKYAANSKRKEPFYTFTKSVYTYFQEIECSQDTNPWKGNFKFAKNLRNSFTHSLNPHIVNFNNGNFRRQGDKLKGANIPTSPLYETKRLLEDFVQAYDFIVDVRNNYVKQN